MRLLRPRLFVYLLATVAAACGGLESGPGEIPEYVSRAPASGGSWNGAEGAGPGGTLATDSGGAPPPSTVGTGKVAGPVVPGGRVAEVKEADVYRIQNDKLFLLNTYRGFLVYDLTDVKKPVRLAHLPVYGYPVEMFVEGNTVYALLSDALYLTRIEGKLAFQRRHSSQLVTIDISNPAAPRLLKAQDLAGQLREGVARKIENTLYVVSYQPSGYWYYGWGPRNGQQPAEAAWVYSFDVSEPASPKQVAALQVFEGGSTESYDPVTNESHSRWSNGVTLSATANAIMVVQSWYTSDYVPAATTTPDGGSPRSSCGLSRNDQESVVSVVDVSDPSGAIRVAATFKTAGALGDQFKQTYIYDAAANTGTYLGIFARNAWLGDNCEYQQVTQNRLEAWDIVGDGATATQLSAVDFGKPNETVRGSHFDPDRKVAFAITARNTDPLYAISFADRTRLAILSEIDGLSGDMDLFRPVENGQYLLGVGRDNGGACASYVGGSKPSDTWNNQIAVSLIDVRDLGAIRLVQRKCLDVANAGWVSSQVTWNLDQAHKMVGLQSDGRTSVLTVPISYGVESDSGSGWSWYRYETAVGIMAWDLARYDATLPPERQDVITTHGRFVHPNGEVNRSVLFAHGAGEQRELLNISDTHLSFANLQNLDSPVLDAVVELAAGIAAVYRFGGYMVEQVVLPGADYGNPAYEFRVKPVGGDLEKTPSLTTFTVGQVQQAMRHGNLLVLFRAATKPGTDRYGSTTIYYSQVLVYDLSDPRSPRVGGTVDLPEDLSPYGSYYRYYCGDLGYYGGHYFGYLQSLAQLDEGIAFLIQSGDYLSLPVTLEDGSASSRSEWVPAWKLAFLDLRDPARPAVRAQDLALPSSSTKPVDSASLVADGASPSAFYLTYRRRLGTTQDPVTKQQLYDYASYAQRWALVGTAWQTEEAVNIPGSLIRTWTVGDGDRLFLTRDDVFGVRQVDDYLRYYDNVTLNLLRQVTSLGKRTAQRLDTRTFVEQTPRSMVLDRERIYLTVGDFPSYWGYVLVDAPSGGAGVAVGGAVDLGTSTGDTSDRLTVLDLSAGRLAVTYDEPTGLDNLDLMGVAQDKLFVNLQGDGILLVDVGDPAAPEPLSFLRTLGWASGVELAGTSAYIPAYYYGTYRIDLTAPGDL